MHSPCQAITAGSSKRHFEQMFELSPGRLEFRLESFEKCFELQSAIFQKLSELFSSSPYATFYSERQQKLVNTFKSLPEHREERSLNSASSELEKCNKLCVCVQERAYQPYDNREIEWPETIFEACETIVDRCRICW